MKGWIRMNSVQGVYATTTGLLYILRTKEYWIVGKVA
jgi:hypothetical protein